MAIEKVFEIFEKEYSRKIINKDVIIYGTGSIAKEVYQVLINRNHNVNCFINMSFNHNNLVEDLGKVYKADDKNITKELKENSTVIIAIFNPCADVHGIINQLNELGFKGIITFTELFDIFEGEFEERFYLNASKNLINDKEKIISAANLWNDEKSNRLYESIVKFRFFKDYKYLLGKDPLNEQYFSKDIDQLYNQDNIRFVDCGAFDGDTIEMASKNFKNVDSVIAFEPDLSNYKKMLRRIKKIKMQEKIRQISTLPCAVYSKAVQMKFLMEGSTGSNISDSGLAIVQCVSIDESIGDYNPTYIKMDIEGAEYEALLGAKSTICRSKPNLAICLYHTPDDFYRIPLLINSWKLGYKFYLRMYSYSAFELVLYAVI